jgi:hypothetical protein
VDPHFRKFLLHLDADAYEMNDAMNDHGHGRAYDVYDGQMNEVNVIVLVDVDLMWLADDNVRKQIVIPLLYVDDT